MKNALFYIFLSLVLSLACRPDPKIPNWETEALSPLVHSRLDLRDLVPDSNISVGSDGGISLVFNNKLAELKPDEIITPLNAEFFNTINLQSIDLGNRVIRDHFSLGDLSKGGSPAGQFIIHNNGNVASVPVFPNVGPKSFPVNATDYFQSISLIDGQLSLSFENQLPVALTNIQFRLENQQSGTILLQSNIDTLKSQQTWQQSYSLANTTIEGQLMAVLQNFSSPGTDTQQVLIDTSDKVLITIELKDFNPSSATAIFPDQVLAADTNYSDKVEAGNAELTSILVDQGKIFIDASSTIEDKIRLQYIVPGAIKNAQVLSFTEDIDPAPPGGVSTAYREVDLSGYQVDLTGKPGDVGIYNQYYTIVLGKIDSSGNLINLSLEDSVFIKTGVINLTAARGFGYLANDQIDTRQVTAVDVFNIIDSGSFDLENAKLGLEVANYIGAPVNLRLNSMQSLKPGSTVNLQWSQLGQHISVPAASFREPVPQAGRLRLDLNNSNSNFDELIEFRPDSIVSELTALLNGSTPAPDYNQFIFADYGVQSSLYLEVPLKLSADGLRFVDTSDFDYSSFDSKNNLKNGYLNLIGHNMFPLEASVDLILLDGANQKLGVLKSSEHIKPAEVNPDGIPTLAVRSVARYQLSAEKLDMLRDTHRVVFVVRLHSNSPPVYVKILDSSYIDLVLSGNLNIGVKP